MVTKIHSAIVRIQRVEKRRTRASWQRPLGLWRFLIQAEKTTGESSGERALSFSTLNQVHAAACLDLGVKAGYLLKVRYKDTAWFDAQLLGVELVKDQNSVSV